MPYDQSNDQARPLSDAPASDARPDWVKTNREKRAGATGRVRRRWPWYVGAMVVAILIGGVILQGSFAGNETETTAPQGVATDEGTVLLHPLDVTEVTRGTLADTLRINGTLQPRRQLKIASKASGTVSEVNVRLGDQFKQGDLLLQLDDEILRSQLDQEKALLESKRAQFALAEAQAGRAEELAARGVSANASLETATSNLGVERANLAVQGAAVSAAEIALLDARIIASFDGIVAKREVEPGQAVSAGAALFELVDLSEMTFTVNVPVSQTVHLEPGQNVSFTVEGLPDRRFEGRVEGVSPTAVSGSRNAPVSVTVSNPDGILRGGMYATGTIERERITDAIAVPQPSIREDGEGKFVLKISDGKLNRQAVETGRVWQGDTMMGVLSGLEPGDQIVSGRLPELAAGMPARVTESQ